MLGFGFTESNPERLMKTRVTITKRVLRPLLFCLGAMLTMLPLWSQAQQVPIFSAADKQAIENYNLNDDNFKRLMGATKEASRRIFPTSTASTIWPTCRCRKTSVWRLCCRNTASRRANSCWQTLL
jgi:hypothetical protein